MVVAVAIVGVVKVAFDQVIDMIAMGNRRMAAVGAMFVAGIVASAKMIRGATVWIFSSYGKTVLFDLAAFLVVQMTIMKVIDMAFMDNGGVSTGGTVFMLVIFAGVRHVITSDQVKGEKETAGLDNRTILPGKPKSGRSRFPGHLPGVWLISGSGQP